MTRARQTNSPREALRRCFHDCFPAVTPTRSELRGIARGRAEIAKGKYVTLGQLLHAVDTRDRKASPRA